MFYSQNDFIFTCEWYFFYFLFYSKEVLDPTNNAKFEIFHFLFFRLNQSISYSFNVSLLVLLKTNNKIAILDVFVTVIHLKSFEEIFFYTQSHLFNRRNIKNQKIFSHVVFFIMQHELCTSKCRVAVSSEGYARIQFITFSFLTQQPKK